MNKQQIPEVHTVCSIYRDGTIHIVRLCNTLQEAHACLKRCLEQQHMVSGVVRGYAIDFSSSL